MSGPCAKAHVTATLTTVDGRTFLGTNAVRNPQAVCPRVAAGAGRDDYTLCRTVCGQPHHAEVGAIKAAWAAGVDPHGGTMRVSHWRICRNCGPAMAGLSIQVVCEGVRA